MVQRAASAALVVLGINILGLPAVDAASERTTALVTIAEANTRCLVETKRMKAAQARDIANRFLISKRVGNTDLNAVKRAAGYHDLMRRYIDEQGGCAALVRALR